MLKLILTVVVVVVVLIGIAYVISSWTDDEDLLDD